MSTFFLNYESVFLYIFLDGLVDNNKRECVSFKCPTNPLKRTKSEVNNQLIEYVSFINYSLILLKLADNAKDSKNITYRLLHRLLGKKKRYLELESKYNITTKICNLYDELYDLEINNSTDFDACAKTMGLILYEIVNNYFSYNNLSVNQPSLTLAQHLGMWIYLIDAFDDFEDDIKNNSFNPLFSFATDVVTKDGQQKCLKSGELMLGMMSANIYRMIGEITLFHHSEIIQNIAKFGMNAMVQKIIRKRNKK